MRGDQPRVGAMLTSADAAWAGSRRSFATSEDGARRTGFRRRGWLVRRALVAADAIGLTLAFVAAQLTFDPAGRPAAAFDSIEPVAELGLLLHTLPMWFV